jgi:hypothetical protein
MQNTNYYLSSQQTTAKILDCRWGWFIRYKNDISGDRFVSAILYDSWDDAEECLLRRNFIKQSRYRNEVNHNYLNRTGFIDLNKYISPNNPVSCYLL